MDALEQLAQRLAAKLTPDAAPGPEPVQRRWGVCTAVNANGTVDVELADSGVTIPGVKVLRGGAPQLNERCAVDFVGGDLMVVGTVSARGIGSVDLLNFASYLAGAAPPAGVHALLQIGTTVNAGGATAVAFPTAFPNGLITVNANFGDSPGASVYWTGGYSLAGFNFYSGAGVGHRINWSAWGW